MMKRKGSRPGGRKEVAGSRVLPAVPAALDARRSQRLKTTEVLKGGRTPLQLVEVADCGERLAEEAVEKARETDRPPSPACKEGCDWCCHLRVGTAVPEVIRIVEYLRQTLSPEELRATRERVARLAEQRRQMKPHERNGARLPCALLVNQRCSAYPVRPLTCRGFNSTDAALCEQFVKGRGRVAIPLYPPQQQVMTFVLDGMRAGLAESGLKADLLELTAALHIALETPNAVDRWLAGEPLFAPARLD